MWGLFQMMLVNKYLINLDEVTIADSQRYINIIQSLVTQEVMVINGKKISQFVTRSCHRFIMTADTEMPIPVRRDERRFFVIRSSDELKDKAGAFLLNSVVNTFAIETS